MWGRVKRSPLFREWTSFLFGNFWNQRLLVVQVLAPRDHPLDVGRVRVALDVNKEGRWKEMRS